ncbi:MAG: response regulator transcription factor [Flavobacteriales bacterium]|nr:response regulator transcription factor [Flavobacteriales bacterium]
MKLLLADDQSIILDGLEALLEHNEEVQVVGRASNGREAVERSMELKPDVVLMDISMPEMDGIEATKALLACSEGTRVLVLSMYDHHDMVHEIMEAGASGYVLKNVGKEELCRALRMVADGQQYFTKEVEVALEMDMRAKENSGETGFQALTKREKQVVELVCMERTTQEIATVLFLSPQTIDTHRKNIMHKLSLRNTAGLVKYAKERGWC